MPAENDNITVAIIVATTMFVLLGLFVVLFFFLYKKRQQHYKEEKTMLQRDFQQALLQTQLEIQEQTLKTVSEEIHDNIGQILSLAKLNLNTFPESTPPEIVERMDATKQLVAKAISDLRDLSKSMHGDRVAELGLQEAVSNELKIIRNTGQFQTITNINGTEYKLPHQQQTVLFRMVQEALNNSIKHSKATHISVTFIYTDHFFELDIIDNGIGFDSTKSTSATFGMGLKSMPNRASLIGAVFSVYSNPESGTRVNIHLPIQQP